MRIPEVLHIEIQRGPGRLAKVLNIVGQKGYYVEGLQAVSRMQNKTIWELTLEMEEDDSRILFDEIADLHFARVIGRSDRVFDRHEGGKIKTEPTLAINNMEVLRDVYTPGVARVCRAIAEKPELARRYTAINNTVAVVTNGTAILGLGNIGPVAGMPVMEGKAALFASLTALSAVPILIDTEDADKIIETVCAISHTFGAIQIEDIKAPECFYIEDELRRRLDIPVLHDDQHGTAVVTLAALINAAKYAEKELKGVTVGQIGLGAAGIGISKLLATYGIKNRRGADLNPAAQVMFAETGGQVSNLEEIMATCDVIIATTGVKGLIKPEMVREGQIILALSNPEAEIAPEEALRHGAAFAADGRNINNVAAFPGLFRGILDCGGRDFTGRMLIAAAEALAHLAGRSALVPDPLDKKVHAAVARAVSDACEDGDDLQ
ncbi:MAG: NADP-dependent malic enzyme [Cryomorphaceae bacterium]|nr:NAD-dependent malic enzyme [Flavobacteriales bacterium]